MALPHDLRDCELRSFVEIPPSPRGQPDNPTARQVVLVDGTAGTPLDVSSGAVPAAQGPQGLLTTPWWFGLVDPITRVWAMVQPGSSDSQRGALVVNTEGQKLTYTAVISNYTPGATQTDIIALAGATNKTVRVTRIEIVGAATALAQAELLLIKRSTANSAGTPTTATAVAHDSNNLPAAAALVSYAISPTLGTTVGTVRQAKYQLVSTTAAAASAPIVLVWDFGQRNEQAVVLRGVAQMLCLNQNSGAIATGTVYDVTVSWTEE